MADLREHLGYWLRLVSNQVSGAFRLKLAERGVSVAEWAALREIFERREMAPSLLAEALGMTRGGATKLIDRLVERGLVGRSTAREDRRYQVLALTPAAEALVPELTAVADANDAEFFADLDAADRATVERVMRQLAGRLGLTTIPIE